MERKLTIKDLLCGRWLLSTLTLLLMSVGMQAENYGITVAGVEVTDANAGNITGANITAGTVSFEPQTSTLTLNNVSMNGNVVSSLAALNVKLVGVSTFNIDNSDGNSHYLFYSNNSSATLTFTADELGATLQGYGTTNNYKLDLEYWFDVAYDNEDYWSATTTQMDDKDYCQVSKPYVIVDGSAINDANKNNPDISGVSFDLTNNKVTLSGFQRENQNYNSYSLITSNIANLNVDIQGGLNYIYLNTKKTNEEITSRGFVYTGASGQVSSLNVTVAEGSKLLLSWSGQTATTNWLLEGFSQTNMALDKTKMQEAGVLAEAGVPYDFQMTISNYTPPVSYGITVAGVEVNSENASNITGDNITAGTVSFNPQTNTLTLNNASISAYDAPIVSGLENLTVFLVGENTIYGGSHTFSKTSAVEEATITFTTDGESKGSLFINNLQQNLFGEGVTPVYSNVFIKHEGDSHTIDCLLGVRVGGVEVTPFNKGNVLGDGKVSYNSETYTLTLNNATIEPEEETSGIDFSHDEDFTIALIGDNSVRGGEGCTAISHSYGVETPNLYFAKGDPAQHFSLTLTAQSEDDLIDGFDTNYGDFFVFDNEDDGTYTSTISSSVFGGTGSANEPFLIKTAEDLKNFAFHYNEGHFSNNVHIQLFTDIDCEDEEGFTTIANNTDATFYGVFDGNHKTISNLTMTGIGLFGYVSKDEDFGVGTIKDLTLSNFNLTGNDYSTGGIVETLSGGAVVSNCTVKNSTIACSDNQYNPEVGGIVAKLENSTVSNCIVDNTTVNATTSYPLESGPQAFAAGIAASNTSGTISGCQVINGTKIMNFNAEGCPLTTGAIVANTSEGTFTSNTYSYDVKVETGIVTNSESKDTKSGYTHRGTNAETDPDGISLYTQKVTLPAESGEASVRGEEGTYYSTVVESDVLSLLVAPGQTATVNVMPGEGYAIASFTATNTTTGVTISTSSVYLGDNITQYSFTMPDAPVTVAVVTVQTIGIRVAGVEVTEQNSANVLGDGKVSYDEETSTLTLNKATINGCIYLYGESKNSLTVHLVGENIIDGGYVSQDENGDWAFGTSVEKAKLSITTDETNPGQLLLRNCYINKWNNAEYYDGWYPALKNGLTETENYNDNKVLIAQGPVLTPGQGIYWTDQLYTFTDGAEVAFRDNEGHTLEVSVNENSFTLPETRKYTIEVSKTKTVDNTEFYMYSGGHYTVYNKPGFSIPAGTYNGPQSIKLTNLPTLPEDPSYYPQVWYYLDDNKNDSVQYTSAQQEIELMESAKVCVYFLDEDSDKLKSAPVEAEYVILQQPGYHFSDSESGQSYYSSGTTVYNLDFGQENTLPWLINVPDGLTITYASEDENVATIDQTGKITLTGAGHVWLTASNEETAEYAAHTERIRLEIRPTDPQASLEEGAYYVGQKVTLIPTVPNGTIYYSFGSNGEKTKYTEGDEIVLPKGEYEFYTYTRCVTEADDSETDYMQSYGNNHRYYYVYDQPTFSVEEGTYNDDVKVKIENLPTTNSAQVYYYFYDETLEPEDKESVLYHADDVITMTESKMLKAYIVVEGDSGKQHKTEPVEAEYTVIPKTKLNISYGENTRTWASYCASENSLETPEGMQAYVVKEATKSGVVVEAIDYIPQGVGVLLKRTAETISEPIMAKAYMKTETETYTSELVGTTASQPVKMLNGTVYVLYNDGFTRATSGSIGANRGYLLFADVIVDARLSIFEDETTAIEHANRETINNNKYYNLNGQRVAVPKKKGLYILNGQTVIVK